MKHYILRIVIILLVLSTSSCDKGFDTQTVDGSKIRIDVEARITDCAQTKGPVFPDGNPVNGYKSMPSGSTFGLFICKHPEQTTGQVTNPYEEYSADYNNIQASRYTSYWKYTYGTGYGKYEVTSMYITIQKKINDKGQVIIDDTTGKETIIEADMFAYAPYKSGVISPEDVPFDLRKQEDLMYCIENASETINKRINPRTIAGDNTDPSQTPSYQAQFSFEHLLALLEFKFTLKNNNSTYSTLSKITVTKGNDSAKLYTKGSMDAVKGCLKNLSEDEEESLSMSYSNTDVSEIDGGKAYLMLVPNENYNNGDFIFEFTFNGIPLSNTKFKLLKEHLRHGTSEEYGLKAGYKYTLNFVIDNYIHFKNIEIGRWAEKPNPLMDIVI